jgi:tRNA threonylcarbamoyladenosine biosynthesis protein TsaE
VTVSIARLSPSTEQTMAIGAAVVQCARDGDIIALIGELGAGKTAFVRGIAVGLGISGDQVNSPTFVIMQEYQADDALNLVHIDAYRLRDVDELESIGWEGDGHAWRDGAIVAIEWADRITAALGESFLEVRLEHEAMGRRLGLAAHGSWIGRMAQLERCVGEA